MQASQKYEHIWKRFIKVLESEVWHTSQTEVARKLGVNRGQISKWISGYSSGANIKTFLGVLDKFNVPYQEIFIEEPTQFLKKRESEERLLETLPKAFDKALAKELKEALVDADVSEKTVSSLTKISRENLTEILNGKKALLARQLHQICTAIDHNPKIILNRAARISKEEKQTLKSA